MIHCSYSDENNLVCPPALAIAPPTLATIAIKNDNWFYITRFQPHETEDNVVRYIAHHANCDSNQIACQKLVRLSDDSRPLTFLSFKINVPKQIEQVVLSGGFWPAGVSIAPFLDRRSNSRKPIGPRVLYRSKPLTPWKKQIPHTTPLQAQTTPVSTHTVLDQLPPYRPQDKRRYQQNTTSRAPQMISQRIIGQRPKTAMSRIRTSLV